MAGIQKKRIIRPSLASQGGDLIQKKVKGNKVEIKDGLRVFRDGHLSVKVGWEWVPITNIKLNKVYLVFHLMLPTFRKTIRQDHFLVHNVKVCKHKFGYMTWFANYASSGHQSLQVLITTAVCKEIDPFLPKFWLRNRIEIGSIWVPIAVSPGCPCNITTKPCGPFLYQWWDR